MAQHSAPAYTQPPSAAPHFEALSKWHLNEMIIDTQIRWRGAVVVAVVGGGRGCSLLWGNKGSAPNLEKGKIIH